MIAVSVVAAKRADEATKGTVFWTKAPVSDSAEKMKRAEKNADERPIIMMDDEQ
jgi:hypothetical protein